MFLHTICVFSRKEEGDYSGGGLSALRVTSSPPKLGGVRGGLNKRYNYRGLLHWPFFRPPRPSGSPPRSALPLGSAKNSGGEEVTLSAENSVRTALLTPCALDVNRNFDLHVFSRADPVAAATNLADKSVHPVLENRCHILIAHSTTAQLSEVLA